MVSQALDGLVVLGVGDGFLLEQVHDILQVSRF